MCLSPKYDMSIGISNRYYQIYTINNTLFVLSNATNNLYKIKIYARDLVRIHSVNYLFLFSSNACILDIGSNRSPTDLFWLQAAIMSAIYLDISATVNQGSSLSSGFI